MTRLQKVEMKNNTFNMQVESQNHCQSNIEIVTSIYTNMTEYSGFLKNTFWVKKPAKVVFLPFK